MISMILYMSSQKTELLEENYNALLFGAQYIIK